MSTGHESNISGIIEPDDEMASHQSGGVNLSADDISAGGDIIGRDKTIAGGDAIGRDKVEGDFVRHDKNVYEPPTQRGIYIQIGQWFKFYIVLVLGLVCGLLLSLPQVAVPLPTPTFDYRTPLGPPTETAAPLVTPTTLDLIGNNRAGRADRLRVDEN